MRKVLRKFLSIMLAVCTSAGFVLSMVTTASAHQGTHGTGVVYANPSNMINKVAAQMQKRRKRIVLYYHGSSASLDSRMISLYDISTPTSHQYTLDTMEDLYYTIDWSHQKKGWVKYILTPNYKITDAQEATTQKKAKSILKKLPSKVLPTVRLLRSIITLQNMCLMILAKALPMMPLLKGKATVKPTQKHFTCWLSILALE